MLRDLQLRNFRCFAERAVEFSAGFNFIVGANGRGKTTLLEGACVLVRLQSQRAATLAPALRAGERAFVVAGGTAPGVTGGPDRISGPSVSGVGVVMTALRRRGEWLELRLVAETSAPTEAAIHGDFHEARAVDLLGRDLGPLPCGESLMHLPMGAWEIATIRLR